MLREANERCAACPVHRTPVMGHVGQQRTLVPSKAPLPQFIERLHSKRFGRERPEIVTSIEERARAQNANKAARKEAQRQARAAGGERPPGEA